MFFLAAGLRMPVVGDRRCDHSSNMFLVRGKGETENNKPVFDGSIKGTLYLERKVRGVNGMGVL